MSNNIDHKPENNLPWELISGSFTGSLTAEEEVTLQQWLASSRKNLEEYDKIKRLWEDRVEDYPIYREADEESAWKSFSGKIKLNEPETEVSLRAGQRFFRNFVAIAAAVILLLGIGWLVFRVNSETYESTASSGERVVLKDGSTIVLEPYTKIEVASDYNRNYRNVVLISGEAYFDVIHDNEKPFIVRLGHTQVRDMGTSFRIRKGSREIHIDVISGKVEFSKPGSKESRLLVAGDKISYDVRKEQFGEITGGEGTGKLNFDNTPLSEAVRSIGQIYQKTIVIADKSISDRKLTAHLEGMDFSSVLEVICRTLHLEYSVKDGTYVISDKVKEQQ